MNATIGVQPQAIDTRVDRRLRILLVEDDETIAEVLQWRMERQGFHVTWARTGREGLALAASGRPDVVLLDLGLPDTDGLTVCRELYERPETCCVPVIILTATEGPDIIRRTRAAGCRFFLRKPYDPSALLVLIHHALSDYEDADSDSA